MFDTFVIWTYVQYELAKLVYNKIKIHTKLAY